MNYGLRTMYIVGVCLGIICVFPAVISISGLLVMLQGFPILFQQRRVGKNGKLFTIYKFRTMEEGAQAAQKSLARFNEADGPVFKMHDDPRYTLIGKFLAHTGLDELPQLYNVIRGEMALFGPRPLPIAEVSTLRHVYQKRHSILPGIISPAILTGRYHEDFDAWMKSDIMYISQKSFWYDCSLILRSSVFLLHLLFRELFVDKKPATL